MFQILWYICGRTECVHCPQGTLSQVKRTCTYIEKMSHERHCRGNTEKMSHVYVCLFLQTHMLYVPFPLLMQKQWCCLTPSQSNQSSHHKEYYQQEPQALGVSFIVASWKHTDIMEHTQKVTPAHTDQDSIKEKLDRKIQSFLRERTLQRCVITGRESPHPQTQFLASDRLSSTL